MIFAGGLGEIFSKEHPVDQMKVDFKDNVRLRVGFFVGPTGILYLK